MRGSGDVSPNPASEEVEELERAVVHQRDADAGHLRSKRVQRESSGLWVQQRNNCGIDLGGHQG